MEIGITDIVILAIVLISAVYGALKGFISQLVGIASLILGIWGASKFTPAIAEYLKGFINIGETSLHIICFTILLLAIIAICGIIGQGVEKIIHLSLLGWLNRVLGMVFSALKAIIILSMVTFVIGYIQKTWNVLPKDMFSGSQLYPHLVEIANKISPYLHSILK